MAPASSYPASTIPVLTVRTERHGELMNYNEFEKKLKEHSKDLKKYGAILFVVGFLMMCLPYLLS